MTDFLSFQLLAAQQCAELGQALIFFNPFGNDIRMKFDNLITLCPNLSMLVPGLLLLAATLCTATGRQVPGKWQQPNDRDIAWSLQVSSRIMEGEAVESVFWYDDAGARALLSRLDWEMPRVVMLGGSASATIGQLTLHAGFWTAVTEGEGGRMLDYDWTDFGSTKWTAFSDSNTDVVSARTFDLSAEWTLIEDFHGLAFKGLLGLRVDDWSWEDSGGYGLYPQYGYVPYWFDPSVIEIMYEQQFSIPYVGFAADWQVGRWGVSANLRYSPLVSAESEDFHTYRNIRFSGTFDRGEMFGIGVSVAYTFDTGFFIAFSTAYQLLDEIIGDLKICECKNDTATQFSDSAGIENETIALSLGLGMHF
ncbi:MAG: omptin family outer membrane protease [Atribacter sp.]|uniref:omptin family outer membrane protease n=1 Tax=Atribacter sp. TaxID=2847780 RepID=UPI003D981D39